MSDSGWSLDVTSLLRGSGDSIIVVAEGVIRAVQGSVAMLCGGEALVGSPIASVDCLSAIAARLESREPGSSDEAPGEIHRCRLPLPNGEVIEVEPTFLPVFSRGEGGVAVVIREVREVLDVGRLTMAEADAQLLADTAFEGIAIHQNATIIAVNRSFCKMSGYSEEEAVGETILRFVAPECHTLVMQKVAQQSSEPYEVLALHRSGKRMPIEIVGKNILYRGKTARVTAFWDLSARKKQEAERQQLELKLQRAQKLEELGLLAGGIAHDFNNVLLGMAGAANLLTQQLSANDPKRALAEAIDAAAAYGNELTEQLLAYAGKGKSAEQLIDLSALIGEMESLINVTVTQRASLRHELGRNLPRVTADPSQVRQVVLNLVSNAVEALQGREGQITLRTGMAEGDLTRITDRITGAFIPSGTYVSLEVHDTGCGMSTETADKMFDPFFSTKPTGRGMGLAGVLGIIRTVGGSISVESEPGQGTTVAIFFPSGEVTPQPVVDTRVPAPDVPETRLALVIDDEEIARFTTQRMLEARGFKVLAAPNGADGIELMRQHADDLDVVILDANMPGMDGVATLQQIRQLRPDLAVVMASGFRQERILDDPVVLGPTSFLCKPFRMDDLIAAIGEAQGCIRA